MHERCQHEMHQGEIIDNLQVIMLIMSGSDNFFQELIIYYRIMSR